MFSTTMIQSMIGGHGFVVGPMATSKLEFSLIPTSKISLSEGLLGQHALYIHAGENTDMATLPCILIYFMSTLIIKL